MASGQEAGDVISESYLLHSLNFQKFFLLDEEISKRNSCNLLGLVWSLSLRSLPLEVRLIPKARRRFERIKGVHMNMVRGAVSSLWLYIWWGMFSVGNLLCTITSAIKGMLYVILNRKTPEKRPPPFSEDVKHYYSNILNLWMYLGFPETPERTFEIIKQDTHVHLSLQDILSWRQVQHFQRQVSLLREESTGI